MKRNIYASNIFSSNESIEFSIEMPGKCPNCETSHASLPIKAFYLNPAPKFDGSLFAVFFCPVCEKCFYIEYSAQIHDLGVKKTTLQRLLPMPSVKTAFSNNIFELSPRFVEIYHQSEQAENQGLTEICGMGYRKSLEFLVKDYAIKFFEDKASAIPTMNLSQCIDNYINHEHIKSIAKASAWLGNDQTHYVRKHESYDLVHLKYFMASVISFIDSELSYLDAKELISSHEKQNP